MASNYTDHCGLCQWSLTDQVQMEEFNADNRAVDAALAQLDADRLKLHLGSYVGTGEYGSAHPNILAFDFTPKLFLLFQGSLSDRFILAYPPMTYYVDPSASGSSSAIHLAWGDDSVSWYNTDSAGLQQNTLDNTYHYLVLGQ